MRDSGCSVIICSVPRSGSWLLAELLEVTGRCGHPREYFRPDYEAIYARDWDLPRGYSFADFVAAVRAAGSTPDGTFGLKVHWAQYAYLLRRLAAADLVDDARGLERLAREFPRPTLFRLRRHDTAAQAVSWYRAICADHWWDTGDGMVGAGLPAEPDLEAIATLEATLREQNLRWANAFAACDLPVIEVDYAELCADYAGTARRLVTAVGLPVDLAPTRPERLRRQADALSDAWIARYLESREELLCEPTSS